LNIAVELIHKLNKGITVGAKKIRSGVYHYKGYELSSSYYTPESRIAWEAVNLETGESDYRAYSKKELMIEIDQP
jgi:hypothetical protein